MNDFTVDRSMIIIALATFVVGLLILWAGYSTGQTAGQPMPRSMKRNALILTFAGPIALVLWYLLNGLLRGVGYRSVIGYVLAALVFIGGGFATGFFSRLRAGRHTGNKEE